MTGGATSTVGQRFAGTPPAGPLAPPPSPNMPMILGGTPADSQAAVRSALLKQPDPLSPVSAPPGGTLDIGGGQRYGTDAMVTQTPYARAPIVTTNTPAAPQTATSGTGIIGADGKEITAQKLYGAKGRPVGPVGPQGPDKDTTAAILALYPDVGKEGTAANKAYVDAYNAAGSDPSKALDIAHTLFKGTSTEAAPSGTSPAAANGQDDRNAVAVQSQQADRNAQIAASQPSAATQAGAATRQAVGNVVSGTGSFLDNASKTVGDFVNGLLPLSTGDKSAIDANNAALDPFGGKSPLTTPAAPNPLAPPPAPATNAGATGAYSGAPSSTGMLGVASSAPPASNGGTPAATSPVSQPPPLPAGSGMLSMTMGGAPVSPVSQPPVVDPDELKRRAAAASNVAANP